MTDESKPEQVARPTSPVLVDVRAVDWQLLREQKILIYEAIDIMNGDDLGDTANALQGIFNLLDSIQDQAAVLLGEEVVFGKSEDDKPINAP